MVNKEQSGNIYDLVIIGGGVNGAGIARDASGRGARVLLAEKDDLAGHTSSASTKLIHGGLRYLEHYEFRLVREALMERERLLAIAPHIMWPLRFVLPHVSSVRPYWMIIAGLFLYDHLAPNMSLPRSKGINLRKSHCGIPLKEHYKKAFIYSDGWVQDSRLVALNAQDAHERGADIRVRTRVQEARSVDGIWNVTLQSGEKKETVYAKALVNASGPWVGEVLKDRVNVSHPHSVRLVKGSHIVVPKLYDGLQAYIFQNTDKRIIFAIPYEQNYTLIGTTDVPWEESPENISISDDEISYLCACINHYFKKQIAPQDVVWSYAGVRPLYDDKSANASAVTRDYVLDLQKTDGAPILSIFGGKITTYRKLAEHAMEKLGECLPIFAGKGWTADQFLPGGDLGQDGFEGALRRLRSVAPWLPQKLAWRLMRSYGTKSYTIIGDARSLEDMGALIVGDMYAREIDYLVQHEWARTAEDILWRRSKIGLHSDQAGQQRLIDYLQSQHIHAESHV